jgi:hypothetical protein
MAYYYNGAEILTPFTIKSNEPVFEMTTISLKTQRASQGAQRFELSFSTLTSASTEVDSMMGSIEGITSEATMLMPQLPSVQTATTASATLAIDADTAASLSVVPIVNDGVIPKGSFIKFSNHSKIYLVTADVAASVASAPVDVNIYPSLRSAVATTDTLLTGSNVTLTYYRSLENVTGITFTDGFLSNNGSVKLVEAV